MSPDEQAVFTLQADGPGATANGAEHAEFGHRIARTQGPDDGVFAEWRYDGGTLRITNDRYGMVPLFVYEADGRFAVSQSIPAILRTGAPVSLDHDALAVFLHIGFFIANETPFREIRAVGPNADIRRGAEQRATEGGRIETTPVSMRRRHAVEAYAEAFRAAMAKRLDEQPIVLPLSGGRDSRHILFELLARDRKPDLCLSAEYFPPRPNEDASVASRLCEELGLPHETLGQGDEYESEWAKNRLTSFCADEHAWLLSVADRLSRTGAAVYDGIGGDVLSAGLYVTPGRLAALERGNYAELVEDWILPRPAATLRSVLPDGMAKELSRERAVARLSEEFRKHESATNPIGSFCFWNRTRREIALAPFALFPPKLRVHAPYLDTDVYDLLASLPVSILADRTFHSETIAHAYPSAAKTGYEIGADYLDARPGDQALLTHLLAETGLSAATKMGLLKPGLKRRIAFTDRLARFANSKTRIEPRVLLYLEQLAQSLASGA